MKRWSYGGSGGVKNPLQRAQSLGSAGCGALELRRSTACEVGTAGNIKKRVIDLTGLPVHSVRSAIASHRMNRRMGSGAIRFKLWPRNLQRYGGRPTPRCPSQQSTDDSALWLLEFRPRLSAGDSP